MERLRQYLEQRRELGESEFVLDSLSIDDALKAIGGSAALHAADASTAARAAGAGRPAAPAAGANARPEAPPPRRGDSEMHRNAEAAAASGDWREALRAVDAQAGSTGAAPVKPPAAPSATGAAMDVGANSAPSGLHHLETLEAVAGAIAACKLCTLSSSAINHVPGEGNPQARFVVVGEAPGQTEDELGRPFVGKSGDLLTKILEAIGFKREDVFICNVLKHRPPGNRNPNADEIVACRPFLLRQLELLQPKVILAVGTFAAQTLLETDTPIGKLRGVEHRYHGIPLVATYHPAALLRNPTWKRPAWEDVQLARRIFDRP